VAWTRRTMQDKLTLRQRSIGEAVLPKRADYEDCFSSYPEKAVPLSREVLSN
jgi:hypothetical protein